MVFHLSWFFSPNTDSIYYGKHFFKKKKHIKICTRVLLVAKVCDVGYMPMKIIVFPDVNCTSTDIHLIELYWKYFLQLFFQKLEYYIILKTWKHKLEKRCIWPERCGKKWCMPSDTWKMRIWTFAWH